MLSSLTKFHSRTTSNLLHLTLSRRIFSPSSSCIASFSTKKLTIEDEINDSSLTRFQISPDMSKEFEKSLGIRGRRSEEEMNYSNNKYSPENLKNKKKDKMNSKSSSSNSNSNSNSNSSSNSYSLSDERSPFIKGFLELNPYLCSGCGAHFQTKEEQEPGYLSSTHFATHMKRASFLKEKQRAIKLLDDISIDLNTPMAEIFLEESGFSDEIIDDILPYLRPEKLIEKLEQGDTMRQNFDKSDDYYKERKGRKIFLNEDGEIIDAKDKEPALKIKKDISSLPLSSLEGEELEDALLSSDSPFSSVSSLTSTSEPLSSLELISKKSKEEAHCICQRCYKLNHYGEMKNNLRPGWSTSSSLNLINFENMLKKNLINNIRDDNKEVINKRKVFYLIDIFDFYNLIDKKLMKELISNVGNIYFLINKVDLLPKDTNYERLKLEIYRELKKIYGDDNDNLFDENDFYNNKKNKKNKISDIIDDDNFTPSEDKIEENILDLFNNDGKNIDLYTKKNNKLKNKDDDDNDKKLKKILLKNIFLINSVKKNGLKDFINEINLIEKEENNNDIDGKDDKNNNKKKQEIFIIGMANVGKSTFLNNFLSNFSHSPSTSQYSFSSFNSYNKKEQEREKQKEKQRQLTVSQVPGTTLNFIRLNLSNNVTLYDTPGLIRSDYLTTKLNYEELKSVIPSASFSSSSSSSSSSVLKPVTIRVQEGKSILLGGLGSIELLEGKPFFFTFFVSNGVKLHHTSIDRVDSLRGDRYKAELLSPPFSSERIKELGELKNYEFDIMGAGWQRASTDLCLPGLGWVSFTGSGIIFFYYFYIFISILIFIIFFFRSNQSSC